MLCRALGELAVRYVVLLLGLVTMAGASCLGGLRHAPEVEAVADAPRAALDLPVREDRTYWLLRAEPGWYASHEVRYGGDAGDAAVFAIRAVQFEDESAAIRGFMRLSPAYVLLIYRDRMRREPVPSPYPEPLPGEQVEVYAYAVRLPGAENTEDPLMGQLTAIREGAVVIVIESIGVDPDRFVPAVTAAVRAALQAGTPDP
jgi:hypothetical protein